MENCSIFAVIYNRKKWIDCTSDLSLPFLPLPWACPALTAFLSCNGSFLKIKISSLLWSWALWKSELSSCSDSVHFFFWSCSFIILAWFQLINSGQCIPSTDGWKHRMFSKGFENEHVQWDEAAIKELNAGQRTWIWSNEHSASRHFGCVY